MTGPPGAPEAGAGDPERGSAGNSPRREPPAAASQVEGRTVRISSAALFAGALEVRIDHHGAVYRLKQTSLGKLILTK